MIKVASAPAIGSSTLAFVGSTESAKSASTREKLVIILDLELIELELSEVVVVKPLLDMDQVN